jgi:hypothetical protein
MASKPIRLSSERLNPQRKTPDRELVHLALGILTQAVRDLVSPQKKHEKDWEVWQIESKMWFSSEENYPGSFKWVCDIIGTEPEALRKWAHNLSKLDRRQLSPQSSKADLFAGWESLPATAQTRSSQPGPRNQLD